MKNTSFQRTLLGVGVAIALGVGTAACSDRGSDRTMTSDSRTQSDSARTAVADTALTANVKTRLSREDSVAASDIQVTTNNGVVTLEGTVASDYAKSAAEAIARSIEGVDRVDNQLVTSMGTARVSEAGRIGSDTWITTKVKSALLADSVGSGLAISVNTRDGIVTLEGDLDNEDTLEHVREIAADVEGVRRVDTARLVIATRD
ncbi:MAG: BON domain-containing protein [Gammaproteobacteria bacterium]|jgi:hyperosmotically inducible protein|nr:BON domain-containing protein [Gammaproteobacteria bacterium]